MTPDPLTLAAPAPGTTAAPPPPALPSQQQLSADVSVVAFLRGITPPLVCLDAAVAAAASSGVSMHHLRQLQQYKYSKLAAASLDVLAVALRIDNTGDQMALAAAVDRLAP